MGKRGMFSQFKKYSAHSVGYGLPYDKFSLMHYGNTEFGARGRDGKKKITIESLSDPSEKLGNRVGFSELDVKRIKLHYGLTSCNGGAGSSPSQRTKPQQQQRQDTRRQDTRRQESQQRGDILDVSSRGYARSGQSQIIGQYSKQDFQTNRAPVWKKVDRDVYIMKNRQGMWVFTGNRYARSYFAYTTDRDI